MVEREAPDGEVEPPGEDDPLYELWTEGWRPMDHPPLNDEVEAHIERCFGKPATVLHELLSLHVHLDVNVIPPSAGRDFTVYVTSGMSDLPMSVEGIDEPERWSRAELVMALPGPPETHTDHHLISTLRRHARFPHAQQTWLCYGHSLGGEEDAPIAEDTRLSAYVLGLPLVSPLGDPSHSWGLDLKEGGSVHFFSLVPIYPEELALKLAKGSDALVSRFDRAGVTEVYRPDRPSAVVPRATPLLDFGRFFRRR